MNYRTAFSRRMKDTRRKIQKQQQKLPQFISRIIELSFNPELKAGRQMLPGCVRVYASVCVGAWVEHKCVCVQLIRSCHSIDQSPDFNFNYSSFPSFHPYVMHTHIYIHTNTHKHTLLVLGCWVHFLTLLASGQRLSITT